MSDEHKEPNESTPASGPSDEKDRGRSGPPTPPPGEFGRGGRSWVIILGMLILLFLFLNTSPRGQQIDSWDQFVKLIAQPKLDDRGDPELDAAGQPVLLPSGNIKDNLVLVENNRLVATVNPGVRDFPGGET